MNLFLATLYKTVPLSARKRGEGETKRRYQGFLVGGDAARLVTQTVYARNR
jgi:hypothetical protein